ncbi:MAG: hypothetical protein H6807_13500 [Planctomycetes bacterium]|nr:hypothetical protein [Planctomycetota bacterium]
MIINILPIGGLAWITWLVLSGRKSLDDLPEGMGRSAILIAVAILLLILFASALLPLVHGLAKSMRGRLRYSAALRREGGAMRKIWESLLWPPRALIYLVAALLRLGLVIVCLALIAATILFVVRLFRPDALEEQLQVEHHLRLALDWLRARWPG